MKQTLDEVKRALKGQKPESAEAVCVTVLQGLSKRYREPLDKVLQHLNLESSSKIGETITELSKEGLVDGDTANLRGYDGIYSLSSLESFTQKHQIKRQQSSSKAAIAIMVIALIVIIGVLTYSQITGKGKASNSSEERPQNIMEMMRQSTENRLQQGEQTQ
ncbi:MAG: hypothetical protein AAF226_03700 [Verrucomicrobiota bacterium]